MKAGLDHTWHTRAMWAFWMHLVCIMCDYGLFSPHIETVNGIPLQSMPQIFTALSFRQILTDLWNYFTNTLSSIFAIQQLLNFPPHLKSSLHYLVNISVPKLTRTFSKGSVNKLMLRLFTLVNWLPRKSVTINVAVADRTGLGWIFLRRWVLGLGSSLRPRDSQCSGFQAAPSFS